MRISHLYDPSTAHIPDDLDFWKQMENLAVDFFAPGTDGSSAAPPADHPKPSSNAPEDLELGAMTLEDITPATAVPCEAEAEAEAPAQEHTPILNRLPVELVRDIIDNMDVGTQLILGQTCRTMRGIVHGPLGRVELLLTKLERKERIMFLQSLMRSDPDRMACAICAKVHAINETDTPLGALSRDTCVWRRSVMRSGAGTGDHGFWLWNRHIQIALKLARLAAGGAPHRAGYLEKIMAPYHAGFETPWHPAFERVFVKGCRVAGHFSAFPRIVDDRFMVHSVRIFRQSAWQFGHRNPHWPRMWEHGTGKISVCDHMSTASYLLYANEREFRENNRVHHLFWTDLGWTQEPVNALNCAMYDTLRRVPTYHAAYSTAYSVPYHAAHPAPSMYAPLLGPPEPPAASTSESRRLTSRGACRKCSTDFEVQGSIGMVIVRSWQDLGSEGSLADLYWQEWKMKEKARGPRESGVLIKDYGACEEEVNAALEAARSSLMGRAS